jgi:hypothetical protein
MSSFIFAKSRKYPALPRCRFTRRFNASSAGLKSPWGLDLRWAAALRDLQIQLEPPSQPK